MGTTAKLTPQEFDQLAEACLQAGNQHFQGIRLHCRTCGENGLAGSVQLAEFFGWSELVQLKGPNYAGRCIDCSGS